MGGDAFDMVLYLFVLGPAVEWCLKSPRVNKTRPASPLGKRSRAGFSRSICSSFSETLSTTGLDVFRASLPTERISCEKFDSSSPSDARAAPAARAVATSTSRPSAVAPAASTATPATVERGASSVAGAAEGAGGWAQAGRTAKAFLSFRPRNTAPIFVAASSCVMPWFHVSVVWPSSWAASICAAVIVVGARAAPHADVAGACRPPPCPVPQEAPWPQLRQAGMPALQPTPSLCAGG